MLGELSKARAKARRRGGEKWEWVIKPGDKIVVSRTAVIPSKKLSRRDFRALEEVVNIYSKMLGDVLSHASRNIIESYYRLKNEKYHELRNMYPNIPSHYIHGVCQDAVERVSSLRRNKARQYSREIFNEIVKYLNLGKKDLRSKRLVRYLRRRSWGIARDQVDLEMMEGKLVPRINSVSLWLVDDHVWKPVNPTKININGFENIFFTSVAINTHRGWVYLDLEPSKEFYKLLARGFKPTSHAKIKLDRRNRRVIFHLSLEKEVEIYKPGNIKPVDVNENSVATLYEAFAAILETDLAKTTLGYSYRKESIQRRNGSGSREARKAMKKLKERKKKRDYRWKTANLIVRDALRIRGVIAIERISGDDIRIMIARYRDKQLRHRIYQSALKGELNVIIDKAREYGVPVLMVDPRNTSKICPIHKAIIEYGEDRIGVCSKGGERWHREVVALINIYLKALEALYEGNAQKGFGVSILDGSTVPLGSTATHEPIEIPRSLWGRWKSLDDHRDVIASLWIKKQSNTNKLISMTINDHRGTSGLLPKLCLWLEPLIKN
jgi:IS605 OrfB family transposase